MSTKGYHSYRGKNTGGKVALIVLLLLILLAAVGYLLAQEFVVYDDEGRAHWELPWQQAPEEPDKPDPLPDDDVDITRDDPQYPALETLHAQELPYGCLGSDPTALLTGQEAVVVNVKLYDGSVAYHTGVALPGSVLSGGLGTLNQLQTILSSDCYTVARLACFCDNAYAVARPEEAALCTPAGALFRDENGRRWLDPSKPETLSYLSALARECAQLGFDEILLDWFSYPLGGDTSTLELPEDRETVLRDFAQALRRQLPEDTRLSVVLRQAPNQANGLTTKLLTGEFDRVYVYAGVDASVLPGPYAAARRVVYMVDAAPADGSYMLAQ